MVKKTTKKPKQTKMMMDKMPMDKKGKKAMDAMKEAVMMKPKKGCK